MRSRLARISGIAADRAERGRAGAVHQGHPEVHGDADADQPDPAGAHRSHRRVRGGGPGQEPHPADGDLLQVRGLSGDPSHLSAPNYKADLRQGVAVEYVSCEPTGNACEMVDEDEPVEKEQ